MCNYCNKDPFCESKFINLENPMTIREKTFLFFVCLIAMSVLVFSAFVLISNAQTIEKPLSDPLSIDTKLNIIGSVETGTKTIYAYTTEIVPQETNEILLQRTENTKVFDLGNGQKEYRIYSGVPQFYFGGSEWYQVEYGQTDTTFFKQVQPIQQIGYFSGLIATALAQTSYTAGSGDGYVGIQDAVWSNVHDATTGDTVDYTGQNIRVIARWNGANYFVYRGFLPFDTSAIADGDTVTNAVVHTFLDTPAGGTVVMATVTASQASYTTLTTADIDAVSDTSLCTYSVLSSDSANTDYSCTLNDLTGISKTGYSPYAIRQSVNDVGDVAPSTNYEISFRSSEYTGTAQDPYISITTTAGGGGGGGSATSTSATSSPEEIMAITQFSSMAFLIFFLSLTSTVWIWTRFI